MQKLLEIASRLSQSQLTEVEDFAEFLAARGTGTPGAGPKRTPAGGIDVSALVGLCEGMGGSRTSKELIKEALRDLTDKYMDE
jgi:hypothetical protein